MNETPEKIYKIQMDCRYLAIRTNEVYLIETGELVKAGTLRFPDSFYKMPLQELNAKTLFIYTEGRGFDPDEGFYSFDDYEVKHSLKIFKWRFESKEIIRSIVFNFYKKRYEIRFPKGKDWPFLVHDNEKECDYPENQFPEEFYRWPAHYLDKMCRFIVPPDVEELGRYKFKYEREVSPKGLFSAPKTVGTHLTFELIRYKSFTEEAAEEFNRELEISAASSE